LWVENGYAWVDDWRRHLSKPVSRELGDILDKLLKRDFLERYQSTDEVIKDLNPKPLPPPQKSSVATRKTLPKPSKLPQILGIITLSIMMLGGLQYLGRQGASSNNSDSVEVAQTNPTTPNPQPSITSMNATRLAQIDRGWLINTKANINVINKTLLSINDVASQAPQGIIIIPPASLLQVVQKQQIPSSQDYRLQVKVCSVGGDSSNTLLKPGEQVWLKSTELTPSNVSIAEPTTSVSICSSLDDLRRLIEDERNSFN
jgi:protein phosphatase